MLRNTLIGLAALAMGGFFAVSAPACASNQCATYCDAFIACLPDRVESSAEDDGGLDFGFSCEWEDGEDEARQDCVDACEEGLEESSERERETVMDCFTCLEEELGGECTDGDDLADALDDCDNDCEDEDVEDFAETFADEGPELECETTKCPIEYQSDGFCDEPEICPVGTDSADCAG